MQNQQFNFKLIYIVLLGVIERFKISGIDKSPWPVQIDGRKLTCFYFLFSMSYYSLLFVRSPNHDGQIEVAILWPIVLIHQTPHLFT